jgi:hypothetical protein
MALFLYPASCIRSQAASATVEQRGWAGPPAGWRRQGINNFPSLHAFILYNAAQLPAIALQRPWGASLKYVGRWDSCSDVAACVGVSEVAEKATFQALRDLLPYCRSFGRNLALDPAV